MIDIDDEVKRFLDYWKAHRSEDMVVTNGVLLSQGCQGDHGCCSEHVDLDGLADALSDLSGFDTETNAEEKKEPHDKYRGMADHESAGWMPEE